MLFNIPSLDINRAFVFGNARPSFERQYGCIPKIKIRVVLKYVNCVNDIICELGFGIVVGKHQSNSQYSHGILR